MEHSLYLKSLKGALRARGMTYEELARNLRMSESGVKKMLNAKDISFRRILRICDFLGILPGELFTQSESQGIATITLTPRQENALLADRALLKLYWLLTVEKRPFAEISRANAIAAATLRSKSRLLVRLELATERNGEIRPRHSGKFRWPDQSRLAKTLNREWSRKILDRALEKPESPLNAHRLLTMRLSERAHRDWLRKFHDLCDETVRISEREQNTIPSHEWRPVSALFAMIDEGVF